MGRLKARLYGLVIEFGEEVGPELAGLCFPTDLPIDVRVVSGQLPAPNAEPWNFFYSYSPINHEPPEFKAFRNGNGAIRITYQDGTEFIVDANGSNVDVHCSDPHNLSPITPALVGPIMGIVLRQRGTPCLHASAVVVDGVAIGLVGDSGAGKSTTAAAFARRGYPIVCDDVLALDPVDQYVMAVPAYPRIRLWPDAASGLFGSADALPRMMPGWEKRMLDLNQTAFRFQDQPVPLGALVFLGPRSATASASHGWPKQPAEALMQLVSDSFATNFQRPEERAREFDLFSRLVQTLPLRQISAPADIGQIDSFCEAIVRDVRQQRASQPA